MVGLRSKQTRQQRHQGDADEGHTAASHELLHALALCAGVIIAETFQQIDCTPHAKASAQRNHEGLQYLNCGIEKCHVYSWSESNWISLGS